MSPRKSSSRGLGLLIVGLVAIVAAAVSLPFIGARNLVRGYHRSLAETILVTWCGNLLLIAVGFALCSMGSPIVLSMIHSTDQPSDVHDFILTPHSVWPMLLAGASAACGLLFGFTERSARLEAFSVADDNRTFLDQSGIRVTGGEDVTHYDASNNPLRYMETRGNQMVLMAVGRRNRRAYIEMDQSGRMVRYSGIVPL